MATHNGTNIGETITIIDKSITPGYNVSGSTNDGDFIDVALTVNGLGGDDTIDLTGLTAASSVTSISINGGSGVDTIYGSMLAELIQSREDEAQFDSIFAGGGIDTLKVLGNWVRFDQFSAATSSIETFDASGKIVYGNGGANALDFGGVLSVLNGPGGLSGLRIEAQDGDDTVGGTNFDDLINAGNGADTVYGNGGSDTINGEAGNDTIYGDSAPMTFTLSTADEPNDNTQFSSKVVDGMTLTGFLYTGDPSGTPTLTQRNVIVNATIGNGDASGGIGVNSNPGDGSSWGDGTRGLDNQNNDEMLRIDLNPVAGQQYVAYDGSIGVNLRGLGSSGANLLVKAVNGGSAVGTQTFFGLTGTSATLNFSFPGGFDRLELYVLDAAPNAGTDQARVYVTGVTFASATTGNGNDVLNGGSGTDSVFGGAGDDTILVREDEAQFDTIGGNAGIDTIKVLGSWVRFDGFNAATSSIETFDASGRNVYGNGGANAFDFSALTTVLNSPLAGGGLRINAENGADTVQGTMWGDEINAGSDADTVYGNDGNDTLMGEGGDDQLFGGNGDDLLYGASGVDTTDGGAGNDTLQVREDDAQFDTIQGGTDTDTLKVLGNWVRLDQFNAATSSIETFDASGRNVHGNGGANAFDFSALTTVLNSPLAGGGLRINAENGADTVQGTMWGDEINAGADADTVYGNDGNDTLMGEGGDDQLFGGNGDDLLYGASGVDTTDGGAGNDTLQVREDDAQFDTIQGGADNDTVKVLGNWARFDGFNAGTSSIETFDASGRNVHGNGGANAFDFSAAQMVNVPQVNLENGKDSVTTSTSHTVVTAYDGQGNTDTVNLVFTTTQLGAFSAADVATLNGYVAAPTGKVLAPAGGTHNIASLQFLARNFEAGTANVLTEGQVVDITACLVGIDNVVAMAAASYTDPAGNNSLIVGTAAANTINAGDGSDLVFGGMGNDGITGGDDADCLFGEQGDDVFYASYNQAEFDVLMGGSGTDTLQRTHALGQTNLVLNAFSSSNGIERIDLDYGGSNRDVEGNAGANVLDFSALIYLSRNVYGLGGNDVITATNANARTYGGGDGDDTLNGGSNNDTLLGGNDNDTISGDGGNDGITGGAGADTIDGGDGDDTIYASFNEAEFDTLAGGSGTDTLQRTSALGQTNLVLNGFSSTNGIERINLDWGGSNRDVEGNANGNVLDFSALTYLSRNVFGLGGDDVITATGSAPRTYDGGDGNDTLNGGSNNDTLLGGIGDDIIGGGDGNDRIIGGAGTDTLSGGNGGDVFRFGSPAEGIDTISDFVVVDDQFEISSSGFVGVGGLGTLSATRFALLGSETASTRIVYDPATGDLFYDADGMGGAAPVQFAEVLPVGLALTNADFSIGF